MSNKQRPRLEKFFSRIKTLLVAAPPQPMRPMQPAERASTMRHEQMEFDLGVKPSAGRRSVR